ncbi:MAG TPA: hypothetical protein VN317_05720 [Candidatus Methanoperedens sp.]|nr:hypothetical protein [Candidatus Methanoperedens sp.]
MSRPRVRARRLAAPACATLAAAVLVAAAACGKKAPLRLPDQRPAEHAAAPRASVREGRVTLAFSVPSHRVFPEREEPWVLARILRRPAGEKEFVEVGAVLERHGFAFAAPLAWSEEAPSVGSSVYRVEFRDGARRRRALSEPLEVVWQPAPAPPTGLMAAGDDRAVVLSWEAPAGADETTRYRVYRREAPGSAAEALTPEPIATLGHTDSRITAAREYCYRVRAVVPAPPVDIEGAPSAEACARTEDATPPPPPGAVRVTAVPGGFQVSWEEVAVADLLGYRVYRAIDDGPLDLLTPVAVRGNALREEARDVRPGARFRYVVTAVDASSRRNESPFSPPAEALAIPPAGTP